MLTQRRTDRLNMEVLVRLQIWVAFWVMYWSSWEQHSWAPHPTYNDKKIKMTEVEIFKAQCICVPVCLHDGKIRCQLFHKCLLEVCSTWGKPSAVACWKHTSCIWYSSVHSLCGILLFSCNLKLWWKSLCAVDAHLSGWSTVPVSPTSMSCLWHFYSR